MSGFIDIVCNLYTPIEVRKGQTGIDDHFKKGYCTKKYITKNYK